MERRLGCVARLQRDSDSARLQRDSDSARLQRDREFWFLGTLLLLGSCLGGCSVGAHASGSVHTSGEARADAASQAEKPAPPAAVAPASTAEPPAIQLKQGRLEYRGVINFEYDLAALREDAVTSRTLAEFREFLEKHPEVSLEIEGHTDSRGSEDYN